MKYFKIGNYILLATCILHLMGHFSENTPSNDTERQMMELVNTYTMDLGGGIHRTMMDLFKGFSLFYSLFLMTLFLFNYRVMVFFGDQRDFMKKWAVSVFSVLIVGTALSFVYFFWPPIIFILLATLFTGISISKI